MGETMGLKTPQGTRHGARSMVMEGTRDLQVKFAWAPRFGTLLEQVLRFPWTTPHPITVHISHTATLHRQPRGARAGQGNECYIVTIPAPFSEKNPGKSGRFLSHAEQSHWLSPARRWGLGHPLTLGTSG